MTLVIHVLLPHSDHINSIRKSSILEQEPQGWALRFSEGTHVPFQTTRVQTNANEVYLIDMGLHLSLHFMAAETQDIWPNLRASSDDSSKNYYHQVVCEGANPDPKILVPDSYEEQTVLF